MKKENENNINMENEYTFEAFKELSEKLKQPDQKALLFIPEGSEIRVFEVDPILAKAYLVFKQAPEEPINMGFNHTEIINTHYQNIEQ